MPPRITETPPAEDVLPDPTPLPISANASTGSLARNALMSYVLTFVGMLAGFIVTPLLLHHLGAEQFGIWTLLNAIVGYTALLEIGLLATIAKRAAECLASNDRARLERILSTAFVLYLSLSVLAVVVLSLLSLSIGRLFHLTGHTLHTARLCLMVLAVSQCAAFLFRPLGALLYGAGKDYLNVRPGIVAAVFTASLSIYCVIHGMGIVTLAVIAAAASLFSGLLLRWLFTRELPWLHIRVHSISLAQAHELLKFGSRNAALSIAGTVSFGTDTLIIGLLLPVAAVASYTIGSRLINVVNTLAVKPINALLPAYAHAVAGKDIMRQQQLFTEGISLSTGIALPFTIAFCAFGDRLIRAWVGGGHHASFPVAVILALTYLLMLPGTSSCSLVTATEKNLVIIRIAMLTAVVNILLSCLLTVRLGIIGVALGSLICVAAVDFFVFPIIACRQIQLKFSVYFTKTFAPLITPLLMSILLVIFYRTLSIPPGTPATLLMLLVLLVVCWGTWITIGFGSTRRTFYVNCLRSVLSRR